MTLHRRSLLAAVAGLATLRAHAAAPGAYSLGLGFVDDHGRSRALSEWQGRPVVLAMAYGACKRICSTTLRRLELLQQAAQQKGVALDFVVVSLDPSQDRPEDWAEYRRLRGLVGPNWCFLTGTSDATRRLAAFLGVRYWPYDGHVMHDFRIVRLAQDGSIAQALRWADDDLSRLL